MKKILFALTLAGLLQAEEFDLVIQGGRAMDPETGLDAIRHIGIRKGVIAKISAESLQGTRTLNAHGHVVAAGFIDLHQHAHEPLDYRFKAMDGVTSALELEVGALDVDLWLKQRAGKTPIHHGVSIGHMPVRMSVMGDRPSFLPGAKSKAAGQTATPEQLSAIKTRIERGLQRGALAVGFGLQYTPQASQLEVLDIYKLAARYRASCHVHMRFKGLDVPNNLYAAVQEVISATAITGAPSHIVHIQSTGNRTTPVLLEMVTGAQQHGLDVSAEIYPYTAGMTDIRSAIFDPGWEERAKITYNDLQDPRTGKRLTPDTFAALRKTGGMIIAHTNPETLIREVIAHPKTIVASDGLRGHPRNAGTFARILGKYVRENKDLTLMQALRKCSLWPAQRLEARAPIMKLKGRLQVGAHADLIVFDPKTVRDRSTFAKAGQFSTGFRYVLVQGTPVVSEGKLLENTFPGLGLRAPVK